MEQIPHCALHPVHQPDCPTCARAKANQEPYPLRKDLLRKEPPKRSFGVTGDLTAESLKSGAEGFRYSNGLGVGSASGVILKVLRKLLWPF